MRVRVLNGPNLGRLGRREPAKYGRTTFAELARSCRELGEELGLSVEVLQTDAEHQLLGWVHAAADKEAAVVLNPGAWTHTSIALRDACAMLTAPLVEVHLTNVHAREPFRSHSHISPVATATIVGCGVRGYLLALHWLASREPS